MNKLDRSMSITQHNQKENIPTLPDDVRVENTSLVDEIFAELIRDNLL